MGTNHTIETISQVANKFDDADFDSSMDIIESGQDNEIFQDDHTVHVRIGGVRYGVSFDQMTVKQTVVDRCEKAMRKAFGF